MNSFNRLWATWKALKLPWRRQFLAGQDLLGNTYWEFRAPGTPNRMRRIVKGAKTLHHSDVQAAISPVWHQWLRRTRADAPSLQEQQADVARMVALKEGARLADERWEGRRRLVEAPRGKDKDEEGSGTRGHESQRQVADEISAGLESRAGVPPGSVVGSKERVEHQRETQQQGQEPRGKQDPFERERQKQKQAASNPGGGWQPEAWTPPSRRR